MHKIRICCRLVLLSLVVSTGSIFTALFQRGTLPPTGLQSYVTRWWHRNIARSIGVKVHVYGTPREQATLFVSNHVSPFDITALGSVLPVRFLSKAEVRRWPLMGWLATRAGTLYIARGGKQAASDANRAMAEALATKHNVLLFAEGTITDGNVKKFHSRLMQSAVDTGSHVQPVAIRYPCPEGNKVHSAALTTDDIRFIESAKRLISAKQLEVEIYFAEAVSAENKSRDELASYAETEVRRLVEGSPVYCANVDVTPESGHI
jgi:1-acyl-sn-glycerol-3-phosphate acyltransferase